MNRENWFRVAILIAIAIVVIAGITIFAISISIKKDKAYALSMCLHNADIKYESLWSDNCSRAYGNNVCNELPGKVVDQLDAYLTQDKEFCFKQYPQN